MCVGVSNDTAHAHGGGTLEQTVGHKTVCVGDAIKRTGDGEDTIVDTRNHFTDACSDICLFPQIGDVLACLANDHTGFFRRDDGTQSQLRSSILFFGALRGFIADVDSSE